MSFDVRGPSFLQEELELEGSKESFIYDKTKFLTKEDLEKLNLTNLIGTDLVRASLHGYFVDYSVYMKVRPACIFVYLFS